MNYPTTAARAPYLLCAYSVASKRDQHQRADERRCRNGATWLRDGYGVCSEHVNASTLYLHPDAVRYDVLAPIIGDQFHRQLREKGGGR